MTIIDQANEILQRIEDEADPLRMSLHYRAAADILPELLETTEYFRDEVLELLEDYASETTLLECRIQELIEEVRRLQEENDNLREDANTY